jgi:hypothetical protein
MPSSYPPAYIILLIFSVRVIIALSTRTFFQPDEYFQALEPAHRLAFGYGHLTWEWVSERPIRNVIYPAMWAGVYQLLKWTGLDETELLVSLPSLRWERGLMREDRSSQIPRWIIGRVHRFVHVQTGV